MIVDQIEYAAEYEDRLPGLGRALREIENASEWDSHWKLCKRDTASGSTPKICRGRSAFR